MPRYTKVPLPTPIEVKNITTIFEIDLTDFTSKGGEKHDFCEIFFVQRGKYSALLDGVPLILEQGQMAIFAPNAHHRLVGRTTAYAGIISFEASETLRPLYNRAVTLTVRQRAELSRILAEGAPLFSPADPATDLLGMLPRPAVDALDLQRLKLLLELFLLELYKAQVLAKEPPAPDNRERYQRAQIELLRAYMQEHLDTPLTLQGVARDCSMSVSKIKLLFREHGGTTPMAYLSGLRVKEAQRLIRETSLNFTQIAERVGLGSVHYFSRLFKKQVGMTPTAYAASLKQ